MAHTRSSKKRVRQNIRRRERNRARLSRVRTFVKKAVQTIENASRGTADQAAVANALKAAASELDKAAKTNLIHWKAAARKKSRLARKAAKAVPATA